MAIAYIRAHVCVHAHKHLHLHEKRLHWCMLAGARTVYIPALVSESVTKTDSAPHARL